MFLSIMAMSVLINILHYFYCSPLQFYNTAPAGIDAGELPRPSPGHSHTANIAGGSFSQSVFHWKEPEILTATSAGGIVVWQLMKDLPANESLTKDKVQVISLQEEPITVLTVTDR